MAACVRDRQLRCANPPRRERLVRAGTRRCTKMSGAAQHRAVPRNRAGDSPRSRIGERVVHAHPGDVAVALERIDLPPGLTQIIGTDGEFRIANSLQRRGVEAAGDLPDGDTGIVRAVGDRRERALDVAGVGPGAEFAGSMIEAGLETFREQGSLKTFAPAFQNLKACAVCNAATGRTVMGGK